MADMQALAAAITAAIQAATAAAAPPPNFAADLQTAVTNAINAAQQPPPVVAGAFALPPATVPAASIDYSTSTGAKLYRSATEQLQDDALYYSLDDPDNNLLIENLTTRSSASGWEPIFLVNNDHLLESYGAILRTDITTHVRTILANANRAKQSDAQLLKCLKNSVDANTKATMAASHTDWHVQPA
jgi:hypothetical protein